MRSARPLRARAMRSSVKRVSAERTGSGRRSSVLRAGMNPSSSFHGTAEAKDCRRDDDDDQSAVPQAARHAACEEEGAGAAAEPAEARGVHSRLYGDAEKAELGLAQGREGAAHQRLRGDRLHPGRGPQSAGALGGDDPRRPRERPARRSLPHPARCARYPGREEPQAETLQIRSKTTQVIGSFCVDPRASEARPGNPRGRPQPGRDNKPEEIKRPRTIRCPAVTVPRSEKSTRTPNTGTWWSRSS